MSVNLRLPLPQKGRKGLVSIPKTLRKETVYRGFPRSGNDESNCWRALDWFLPAVGLKLTGMERGNLRSSTLLLPYQYARLRYLFYDSLPNVRLVGRRHMFYFSRHSDSGMHGEIAILAFQRHGSIPFNRISLI